MPRLAYLKKIKNKINKIAFFQTVTEVKLFTLNYYHKRSSSAMVTSGINGGDNVATTSDMQTTRQGLKETVVGGIFKWYTHHYRQGVLLFASAVIM